MTRIYSIQQDIEELEKMSEHLEVYVRGDNLYGQPWGTFNSELVMTIGAMMMRIYRLSALQAMKSLDAQQMRTLKLAMTVNDQVSQEWSQHYQTKLIAEASSRLNAMDTFFIEHEANPEAAGDNYHPELLRRTIVQEIFRRMSELNIVNDDLLRKAQMVDDALDAIVERTHFQWDSLLREVYPPKEYWWLYTEPVTEMKTV